MGARVVVPVEIDILLRNLNAVQSELDKLHLSDKIGKKLASDLSEGIKELDKIQKIQTKGSSSIQDIKTMEHSFLKVQEIINRIGATTKDLGIKGFDVLINPVQLAQLKKAEEYVEDLKQKLKEVEANTVKNAFGADPILLANLQKVLNLTDEQVADANKLIGILEQQKKEYGDIVAQKQQLKNLSAALNTEEKRTGLLENYKNKAGTGFMRGGRDALLKSIRENADLAGLEELMPKGLIKRGSYQEFLDFFQNRLPFALAKTQASFNNIDPKFAIEIEKGLNIVKNALNNNISIDTLKQQLAQGEEAFKGLSDAAKKNVGEVLNKLGELLKSGNINVQEGLNKLSGAQEQTETEKNIEQTAASWQSRIKQLLGLGAILHQVSRMIRNAVAQIKELDKAMTQIAVVTDMTTSQLWGQIDAYMALAKQYGVTTTGVYEVSQLYYQQGLNTVEVMKMTTETLKMAKIAGLDYSAATDYMTATLRGFKMEVEDAGRIVDVYSKLAAIAATDTRELSIAMSKTASIAESSGMAFESASTFLTMMIETTREAPENLGTAMKTIIARFQEMKKSPLELVEVEGEEISLNKVDKALQTIGISLTDASGQFRNLDEVIFELSNKWEGLDRNTQRYELLVS